MAGMYRNLTALYMLNVYPMYARCLCIHPSSLGILWLITKLAIYNNGRRNRGEAMPPPAFLQSKIKFLGKSERNNQIGGVSFFYILNLSHKLLLTKTFSETLQKREISY